MASLIVRRFVFKKDNSSPCKFVNIVKQLHTSSLNKLAQENKELDLLDATENPQYEDEGDRIVEHEILMEKRNKSRLRQQHQNIVHGKIPYSEPVIPYHDTIKYKRKMFGTYGVSSGVDPSTLWPTKDELQDMVEYEKVAYPDSLQQMVARAKLKLEKEEEERKKRENEINLKFAKLEQWKAEIQQRAQKKLMEAQAAKERKERIVEEVRQYFGFKIDPRDERFKEMLEQKEKEDSKKAKAEKKKAKQAKLLAKLVGTENATSLPQTQTTIPKE